VFYLLTLVLELATNVIQKRYLQAEKPAAQTAHLVFADTLANAKKTKRTVFCQRSTESNKLKLRENEC
jgi:hypothetical protein